MPKSLCVCVSLEQVCLLRAAPIGCEVTVRTNFRARVSPIGYRRENAIKRDAQIRSDGTLAKWHLHFTFSIMLYSRYLFVFFLASACADWFVEQSGQQEMYSLNAQPVVLPNVTALRTENASTLDLLAELTWLRAQVVELQQLVASINAVNETRIAALEATDAQYETRIYAAESDLFLYADLFVQLEGNTSALSNRIDTLPAGCAWEGIACQCYLDSDTANDAALLLGSNCVSGTLTWVKILEALHFDAILVSCESFVNASILATCDIML